MNKLTERQQLLVSAYRQIHRLHMKAIINNNKQSWTRYNEAQSWFNKAYTEYERNVLLPKLLEG